MSSEGDGQKNYGIDFFLSKTLLVKLVTVLIFIIGIFSYRTNYREVYPDVDYDAIMIRTSFPSASAEDVETSITIPLERQLKEVDGARRVVSISFENLSVIFVQLDPNQTTSVDAKSEVKEIIGRFKDLPKNAEPPEVYSKRSSSKPILEIGITATEGLSEAQLYQHSLNIENRIRQIKGAASVSYFGQTQPEILIEAQPQALRERRISLSEVMMSVQGQNASVPGGLSVNPADGIESLIRTTTKIKNKKDVENIVVRSNEEGRSVRIKDVARVINKLRPPDVSYLINGSAGIAIMVSKKKKNDSIQLVEEIKSELSKYRAMNPNLKISYINDSSYYIERRISTLKNNLILGLILIFLFLFLFFSWKATLIVSLGIPFAFLGTMIFFSATGTSLNLITMLGLVLVMGMITDDAIVIVENCYRYLENGHSPYDAALLGTREVIRPISASILTTIMSFMPLMFMSGLFGQFVQYIPLGVISCLFLSLFESFYVLPNHFAHWVTKEDCEVSKKKRANAIFETCIEKYQTFIVRTMPHRKKIGAGVLMGLVITFSLAAFQMRFVLFPQGGIEVFAINIEAPVGTSKEKLLRIVEPIDKLVAKIDGDELKGYNFKLGLQQISPDDTKVKRGNHIGQFIVYLTPAESRLRDISEVIASIRSGLSKDSVAKVSFNQVKGGLPVGEPVSVGIRGDDYKDILAAVGDIELLLESIDGVTDISNTYNRGKNEIQIIVDPVEAGAAHVTPQDIGRYIYLSQEGVVATSLRGLKSDVDIRVQMEKGGDSDKVGEKDLLKLQIPNRFGHLIELSAIASLETRHGVSSLEHENGQRQVRVLSEIISSKTSSRRVNKILGLKLDELRDKHKSLDFVLGGENFDTKEGLRTLKYAFLISTLGIFFLLILTFQSYYQPLIILMTIPLGAAAVIWSFLLHNRPLSFFALLSIVALSGVIVNNGIVFVDFMNQKRAEGLDSLQSILETAKVRLRPIVLTTVTTVCGVLPTAYGLGGLDPFVVPVALGLGWGTLLGAIFTLAFLPIFLGLIDDLQRLISNRAK